MDERGFWMEENTKQVKYKDQNPIDGCHSDSEYEDR